MELATQICLLCLLPLIGILSAYIIKWLKAKEIEILDKVDNDTADKYISLLFETISDCVSATTQTYVEALKKQGKFDAEAQKIAFTKSYEAVLAVLTDDAKMYLTNIYGDLNAFIATKIEAEVKAQK
jgi:hypothetical protein